MLVLLRITAPTASNFDHCRVIRADEVAEHLRAAGRAPASAQKMFFCAIGMLVMALVPAAMRHRRHGPGRGSSLIDGKSRSVQRNAVEMQLRQFHRRDFLAEERGAQCPSLG